MWAHEAGRSRPRRRQLIRPDPVIEADARIVGEPPPDLRRAATPTPRR